MDRMPEPTTHQACLEKVFHSSSAVEKEMRVQLARMCVLYEDLQIEYEGARADALPALDGTSVLTRRFYFVRRTLATLQEVSGAIHQLNSNNCFKKAKLGLPQDHLKGWDDAAKFFGDENNRKFLKTARNDIGGHFLDAAARYAIDGLDPEQSGSVTIYPRGAGADIRMPFAYELVTVAMTKEKGQLTEEKFFEIAFTFLKDAVAHARTAIQIVVGPLVVDRFK